MLPHMLHTPYEAVIGLEVHCQLQTAAKIFSPESTAFGAEPNTNVDPVSLGHPGTLPVFNRKVLTYAIRMGLATHSSIAEQSVFARKHYFYPDLPKGYQISQFATPVCYNGYVEILLDDADEEADEPATKRIGLTRIHMEEDAGKSLHDQPQHTRVDFNRCGVPLLEVVSEPDLRTPGEARRYMEKIRQLVRYLGICDGNMEEGSLRCDANVSVRRRGSRGLGTKTEVKNLNSFRHVEQALAYEIDRQVRLIESQGRVVQETLLWDADRGETRPMRSKEEAHDYRYFPDPDLVPVVITDALLAEVRQSLPEMPEARRARFVGDYGLPVYDAAVLTEERALGDYYEDTLTVLFKRTKGGNTQAQAKAVSNFVMTEVLRVQKEQEGTIASFPVTPQRLADLVYLRLNDELSSSAAQEVFEAMLTSNESPQAIAKQQNLTQVIDKRAIEPVVNRVLRENKPQVKQYLGGKHSLLGYFIGQVMKRFQGAPDPKVVKQLLKDKLNAKQQATS